MNGHVYIWRRRAVWTLLLMLLVVAMAEVVARGVLGLGTPPLYDADPDFEYRLRPSQSVQRFGKHIDVNRWGMRSDDFGQHKASPDEFRVLVFGDSVINGGSVIDQAELATSLLQTQLHQTLHRPVVVGNVSAGSWGPGNWLAYARRFGFFDTDVVVLMVNSGDVADNPTFAALDRDHPTQAPVLALQEAFERYLPRYLPMLRANAGPPPDEGPAAQARAQADLRAFLDLARQSNRLVLVAHHPDREELISGRYAAGHHVQAATVKGLNIPFIELRGDMLLTGAANYRDGIHHTALGQRTLAAALHRLILGLSHAPANHGASA